jgi:hypothetical protein
MAESNAERGTFRDGKAIEMMHDPGTEDALRAAGASSA